MIGRQAEQDRLTKRTSRLLAIGNAVDAFRVAERLCRGYARPNARHLLLRAQASLELGDFHAARSDFDRALDIDPSDSLIAELVLRMTRESDIVQRRRAAHIIVASPRSSFATLKPALDLLLAPASPVIAQGLIVEGRLDGWVAWLGEDQIGGRLCCDDGTDYGFSVISQSDHPLTSATRHASTISERLPSEALPDLTWTLANVKVSTKALVRTPTEQPIEVLRRPFDRDLLETTRCIGCGVVVPIYDDPIMTARCLDSLAAQSMECPLTIVMVNDRPHDETMATLTERAKARHGFKLIVNRANLGFVEAVKRGIAGVDPRFDIVLLNADTILPQGALERISRAAYTRPEIGTVTPFSNNGELTSFPKPFTANAFDDTRRIREIDAAAQRVNAGLTVSISNGVGFCLYVKRACLDAIGGFPDVYHRGYFEDVELCLRARDMGFTNVCATDVYVGHAGTRSFRNEKKALVARNAKILKTRFPSFLEEGLAFVKADPLYDARQAIAWERLPHLPRCRLVVSASPHSFALHHRVRRLRRSGKTVLTLTRTNPRHPSLFALNSIGFDLHHDSRVDLANDEDCSRILDRLHALGVSRVDFLDEPDLGYLFAAGLEARFQVRAVLSKVPQTSPYLSRGSWRPSDGANTGPSGIGQSRARLKRSVRSRVVALNAMVSAVLSANQIPHTTQSPARPRRAREVAARDALGIVYPSPSASSEMLLRTLLGVIGNLPVVIIGKTFSNDAFMAHPSVFVTGGVNYDEYDKLVERCRVGLLVSLDRRDGFGILSWLSGSTGRPAAYFDLSHGMMIRKDGDLGLDPILDDDEAAGKLLAWAQAYLRDHVVDA